jgi:hypothetical protein
VVERKEGSSPPWTFSNTIWEVKGVEYDCSIVIFFNGHWNIFDIKGGHDALTIEQTSIQGGISEYGNADWGKNGVRDVFDDVRGKVRIASSSSSSSLDSGAST